MTTERTKILTPRILGDIREWMGAENPKDKSADDVINKLCNAEAFRAFLQQNSIVGFASIITQAFCEIYEIDIDSLKP